jgi:acyl-CoA synthetase (AMP-forming)/AMP-acid ligase II
MCAGAATTTVYPSTVSADVAFILADSDSRVVFAEDEAQVAKLRERRAELPNIRHVIVTTPSTQTGDSASDDWVMSLSALEERGAALLAAEPDAVDVRVRAIEPESLATLIYTSGTTGRPKGVRLRHSGWTYEGAAIASLDILSVDDLQFLWLPMAHSFGKVLLTTQLQIGFPHRRRRARRQDRREPGDHPADVHGRGPADLREGVRPGRHDGAQRGRRQGEDLRLGLRRGQAGRPASDGRRVGPGRLEGQARSGGQAGVLQGP